MREEELNDIFNRIVDHSEEVPFWSERLEKKFNWDEEQMFEWAVDKYKKWLILEKWSKEILDMQKELYAWYKKKNDDFKLFIDNLLISKWILKIENKYGKLSYRKSSQVEFTNEDEISEDYKKIVEVSSIDKKQISNDIKAWIKVKWAILKECQNLQIK